MTFEEIFSVPGQPGSRWLIYEEKKKELFRGYNFDLKDNLLMLDGTELYNRIKDRQVKKFEFHLDIHHKQWKEKGLLPPLMPEELSQYQYSDLQEDVYYTVYLEKE